MAGVVLGGIVKGWMHSPPHRDIMRGAFREIGIAIGVPVHGSGATYTTDFGARG